MLPFDYMLYFYNAILPSSFHTATSQTHHRHWEGRKKALPLKIVPKRQTHHFSPVKSIKAVLQVRFRMMDDVTTATLRPRAPLTLLRSLLLESLGSSGGLQLRCWRRMQVFFQPSSTSISQRSQRNNVLIELEEILSFPIGIISISCRLAIVVAKKWEMIYCERTCTRVLGAEDNWKMEASSNQQTIDV